MSDFSETFGQVSDKSDRGRTKKRRAQRTPGPLTPTEIRRHDRLLACIHAAFARKDWARQAKFQAAVDVLKVKAWDAHVDAIAKPAGSTP